MTKWADNTCSSAACRYVVSRCAHGIFGGANPLLFVYERPEFGAGLLKLKAFCTIGLRSELRSVLLEQHDKLQNKTANRSATTSK